MNDLTERLSDVTEELSLANARVADREAVLATATSERTALSRAMEQNASLKNQLTQLQDALDIAVIFAVICYIISFSTEMI